MRSIIIGLILSGLLIAPAFAMASDAEMIYKKCSGCHGLNGEKKALGRSGAIVDMNKDELAKVMIGYKKGEVNKYAMGALMKTQMVKISEDEINSLATYISGFKKD